MPLLPRSGMVRGLLGFGLLASLGLVPMAITSYAQTPVAQLTPGGTTIEGTVAERFGNKFILQDQTGRVLVETGPEHHHRLELRPGERVRVTGRPEENSRFAAFSLRREDGAEQQFRRPEGPPPWAGRGPERGAERGPRGREEEARISPAEAVRVAQRAGYTVRGEAERKPRHYEVRAVNPRGEPVELHIDLDGRIYKERWERG